MPKKKRKSITAEEIFEVLTTQEFDKFYNNAFLKWFNAEPLAESADTVFELIQDVFDVK